MASDKSNVRPKTDNLIPVPRKVLVELRERALLAGTEANTAAMRIAELLGESEDGK